MCVRVCVYFCLHYIWWFFSGIIIIIIVVILLFHVAVFRQSQSDNICVYGCYFTMILYSRAHSLHAYIYHLHDIPPKWNSIVHFIIWSLSLLFFFFFNVFAHTQSQTLQHKFVVYKWCAPPRAADCRLPANTYTMHASIYTARLVIASLLCTANVHQQLTTI